MGEGARFALRILIALAFAAVAFGLGLFLPLFIYMAVRADPGMPGGAGLALMGCLLGVVGAVIAGLFSYSRFPTRK